MSAIESKTNSDCERGVGDCGRGAGDYGKGVQAVGGVWGTVGGGASGVTLTCVNAGSISFPSPSM